MGKLSYVGQGRRDKYIIIFYFLIEKKKERREHTLGRLRYTFAIRDPFAFVCCVCV